MILNQRQVQIVKILRENQYVSVQQLNEYMQCSLSTLQRDIRLLHENGIIYRNHGTIQYLQPNSMAKETYKKDYLLYDKRQVENLAEKRAIAKAAANIIEPGDVIYITHGTTCRLLARELPPNMPITVFTDGLDIIAELDQKPSARVFCMGGCVNFASRQIEQSPYIPSDLLNANISKLFMGAGGISKEKGITYYDLNSFQFLENLTENVSEIIVLADHSKFNKVSLANFIEYQSINKIICDDKTDQSFLPFLSEQGVECIFAAIDDAQ